MVTTDESAQAQLPRAAAAIMNAFVVVLLYLGLTTVFGITPSRAGMLFLVVGAIAWELVKAFVIKRRV